jgi:hypothetical protein
MKTRSAWGTRSTVVLFALGAACVGPEAAEERGDGAAASTSATHADVTGLGPDVILGPQLLFDAASSKLLYVGVDRGARPGLRRCNHDGSGCTAHFLDAGRGPRSGEAVSAAIDPFANKLLAVAIDRSAGPGKVSLYRCGLDGSACAAVDISGPETDDAGVYYSGGRVVIDRAHRKLVVAACSWTGGGLVHWRCNLDGSACEEGAVIGEDCGRLEFDAANEKLLVVERDRFGGRLVLHRCALDGASCTTSEIASTSEGQINAVVDEANGKLFITDGSTAQQGGANTGLTRCNLDGTGCTRRELEAVGAAHPVVVGGELVIGLAWGGLAWCSLGDLSCTYKHDLGVPRGGSAGGASVAFDEARNTILLGTRLTIDDAPLIYPLAPLVVRQPGDRSAHQVADISAGPGRMPYGGSSVLDEATNTLYVLAENDTKGLSEERRFHRLLSRCDADGTGCTFASADTAVNLLGVADGWLVSIGLAGRSPYEPDDGAVELLRCNPDGTACARYDIERPFNVVGSPPHAALDREALRALVVRTSPETGRPEVLACPVLGTACLQPVALPAEGFGWTVRGVAFDGLRRKLLVSSRSEQGTHLLRCEPDGTRCTSHDLGGVLEQERDDILVSEDGIAILSLTTLPGGSFGKIVATRCDAGGDACRRNDVWTGAGTIYGFGSAVDPARGELLVVVDDDQRARKATLLRCRPDGDSCDEHDMSADQPAGSGQRPTVLFSATTRTVLAVTDNIATERASLFRLRLGETPPPPDGGPGRTDAGGTPETPPDGGSPPPSPGERDSGGDKAW